MESEAAQDSAPSAQTLISTFFFNHLDVKQGDPRAWGCSVCLGIEKWGGKRGKITPCAPTFSPFGEENQSGVLQGTGSHFPAASQIFYSLSEANTALK